MNPEDGPQFEQGSDISEAQNSSVEALKGFLKDHLGTPTAREQTSSAGQMPPENSEQLAKAVGPREVIAGIEEPAPAKMEADSQPETGLRLPIEAIRFMPSADHGQLQGCREALRLSEQGIRLPQRLPYLLPNGGEGHTSYWANPYIEALMTVDRDIAATSPDKLAEMDERKAKWYEQQLVYLAPPEHPTMVRQQLHLARWQQRRTAALQDPTLAVQVAAAEAPIQDEINKIVATKRYGTHYTTAHPSEYSSKQGPPYKTPTEWKDTPYKSKFADERALHPIATTSNNVKLNRLIKAKLKARDQVIAAWRR